jgi:hypothetical protein
MGCDFRQMSILATYPHKVQPRKQSATFGQKTSRYPDLSLPWHIRPSLPYKHTQATPGTPPASIGKPNDTGSKDGTPGEREWENIPLPRFDSPLAYPAITPMQTHSSNTPCKHWKAGPMKQAAKKVQVPIPFTWHVKVPKRLQRTHVSPHQS